MPKKLKVTVQVFDEEANTYKTYMAGDEVPDSVAKSITNPDVWDDGEETTDEPVPGPGQFTNPPAEEDKPATKKVGQSSSTTTTSKQS